MEFSEKNSNIAQALAKAWGCVSTPKHNSKVQVKTAKGSYSFDYTDLTGIFDAVRDVYKTHGIAIVQNSYTEYAPNSNARLICVQTMLLHESGEYLKSLPLKFQASEKMQDLGGQITYMKRYSLSSILGLSTDKDDDANGYAGNDYTHQNRQQRPPNQQQQRPPQQPQQQQQRPPQQPQQQRPPQQPQQQRSPQQPQAGALMTPTTAKEGAAMIINFGDHQGKTLKEVWTKDQNYIKLMFEAPNVPEPYKVAIDLMLKADAEQKAKQKMQQ